jgi:catechol 2,3-dioxygenase-like lactoylglutathione lyase family enzyme
MNVFYNTIVFVKDIKKSRQFYEEILGLKVVNDFNSIVFFENHFVIHDKKIITRTIFGQEQEFGNKTKNILIYVETDDLENSYKTILMHNVSIIHPIKTQEWGQKVFRFFDPDGYIIEIGEAMHLDYLKK